MMLLDSCVMVSVSVLETHRVMVLRVSQPTASRLHAVQQRLPAVRAS